MVRLWLIVIKLKKYSCKKHWKKDIGKPGKGKKIFTIKKGCLSEYGYSMKINDTERKQALNKASKHIPKNTLIRKLNALSILYKNTNPTFSNRAIKDKIFVYKFCSKYLTGILTE